MKKLLLSAAALLFAAANAFSQTTFVEADFESGIPSGWSQSTLATDGGWNVGNSTSLSSAAMPFGAHTNFIATNDDDCNCNKSADSLFTGLIDLTSASGLIVLSYDVFYGDLAYQGAQESFGFYIYTVSSGTWSLLADIAGTATVYTWEDGRTIDLSAYAGEEIRLAFVYNDGAGWTYGAGLDNVVIYQAAQYDVANMSITNNIFQEVNTTTSIDGTIMNMGSETITSLELSYTVAGGTPVVATINGLNIAPLASYAYSHPTDWTPTVLGDVQVVTNIVSINGNPDANASNNTASMNILVHPTPVDRKPLLEQFTSSTCPPCTPGNINVQSIVANFPNQYSKVNYQMSWPGTGDPYFTLEGQDRRTFYGVNSVPSMHTDGSVGLNSNNYTAQILADAAAVPAFINLTVTGSIQPVETYEVEDFQLVLVDTEYELSASVGINPIVDLPAGQVAFVSLQENLTFDNVKTNGETEFHDVMKKMIPSAAGTTLPAVLADETESLTLGHTFPNTYRLSNNAGDPIDHSIEHSIEEWDDLRLVAWVQNTTTGAVWQSENAAVELLAPISNVETDTVDGVVVVTVDGESYVYVGDDLAPLGVSGSVADVLNIYPNPASDRLFVSGTSGNTSVSIVDLTGRLIMNLNTDQSSIDISTLNPGVYNVSIENNGISKTEKITVIK